MAKGFLVGGFALAPAADERVDAQDSRLADWLTELDDYESADEFALAFDSELGEMVETRIRGRRFAAPEPRPCELRSRGEHRGAGPQSGAHRRPCGG